MPVYELLIMARDSPTLRQSPEGAYRRGDVVAIFPAGHRWGRAEGPPYFAIIKAELSEAEAAEMLAPKRDEKSEREVKPMLARRVKSVSLDLLPHEKDRLDRGEIVDVAKAAFDSIVVSRESVNADNRH